MSPNSDIPTAQDNTIANAYEASKREKLLIDGDTILRDAENAEKAKNAKKAEALSAFAQAMLKRMTRHNTPFDGSKKAVKRAKAKASRKANKKRKLYIRHGK